jgi:peptide-methionine (R)-S-oxide reductase
MGENRSPARARREFLATCASVVGSLSLFSVAQAFRPANAGLKPRATASTSESVADRSESTVTIVEFSDQGERLRRERVSRVSKSNTEWRQLLSPNAFEVTRHAATERPFSGLYWNLHDKGLYRCICCDTALFSSSAKYDSGTGWPSFWEPIASENIETSDDRTFGMVRTAVSCRRCDAHLGHVFDDGPQPSGLRYCMNSVALRFVRRPVS